MVSLQGVVHLSFESGIACDLAKEHPSCPVSRHDSFRKREEKLTPDAIARVVDEAVALGFDGYVGFHYYNEPLLYQEFIRSAIDKCNYSRFMLWTNGMLLTEESTFPGLFEWVHITDYRGGARQHIYSSLAAKFPSTRFQIRSIVHDDRLTPRLQMQATNIQCWRSYIELPIDHYGNLHLCCQDWMGSFDMGNIFDADLATLLGSVALELRNLRTGTGVAPAICATCHNRHSHAVYVDNCREQNVEPRRDPWS